MNNRQSLPNVPYWRPIAIATVTIIYCLFFINAHAYLGSVVASMVVFPVILVAGFYGLRAGLIAAILSYALNTLLFNTVGIGGWNAIAIVGGSPGQLVVIVVGSIVGWSCEARVANKHLLTQTRNLNSELNAIIDIMPDTFIRIDANGQVVAYHVGKDETPPFDLTITGKPFSDVLPPELVQVIEQNRNAESTTHVQLSVSNRQRWYEIRLHPLAEQQVIMILRDMTPQKRSEQQRQELTAQQSRIAYLQEFISNLSHDLKTPLTIIKTSLYLLERLDDPARQAEKLGNIKLQTRHLEKLIEDIIMITKLDSTLEESLMFIKLNNIVKQVIATHEAKAQAKGLDLQLDMPEASPMILANEASIQRVLTNILENAVNYTEAGSITIQVSVSNSDVMIDIKDTGIGMTEAEQARMFERFFRADKARSIDTGGAGLGLSIARRLIEIHQGAIHIASQFGVGTTITIELPLFKARAHEYVTNVVGEATRPNVYMESN